MLTVSLLVCAMMALTSATDDEDILNGTMVEAGNITKYTTGSCQDGWKPYNGRCFLFVPTQKSWAKAQEHCLSQKGTLASIHSEDEYSFIQQLTTQELLKTWVGGSDCQEGGYWFWSDSTPKDYAPWCAAQPDNTLDQCCLQINTGGAKCWDDVPCKELNPSVCVRTAK